MRIRRPARAVWRRRRRARPGRGDSGGLGETALARRTEEEIFEPVSGLQGAQRSRADHRPRRSRREERDQEPGERHPRRADGKGRAHPASPRRPAQGSHGPAQVGPRRADRAPEDHGGHGHRREAAAAGRPPCSRPKTAPRSTSACRRSGPCSAKKSSMRILDHRKGAPGARGDRHVGDGAGGAAQVPPPSARHDPGGRPHGQRQYDDPQFGADRGASERTNIITIGIRSSIRSRASTRRRSTKKLS